MTLNDQKCSPLFMASCAPVEVLHVDLNIFVKLCEHLNVNCRQLTLDHKLDGSTFCKKTELVPEWSTCPASSPARKFIQVFESAGQTGLANYYKQQYTDQIPADTGDQLSSSSTDKEQEKLRLIGKTVTAISVHYAFRSHQKLF